MADKNREDWIKSFYFGEAPKQQNTGGLTLADELDRLYEERQKRNKNNHRLVTRSGHDTFMEDEYGRQFFTYEGWKENQEASVAYMKLAGEALKHLGSGFFEGQGYKRLPQNMTEAGLRALDGIIDLGKGAGRFTAKAWRDDEEENKAAYNAYLSLTGKFLDLQGVYKDEEGNIVPPSTPGANKVQGPQSYLGNYARGLGDLFNKPVGGEAVGEAFDEDVNMKWADSWSILLDPTWLIPGGQAAKASNLVDKGVKGEKLARLTKSLKDIAEKVPKSEKLSSAGEWAAQFARRPATRTADLAGKAVSKTGEGIAKAADTKVGKYAAATAVGYGIYKAIEDDESLIDTLIAGIGTYATAKGAPQYIGKVGAKAKTIGNTISGAARGAQMGSLGIAAKQGGYSQGAIEALKRIDNPAMNRTLRLAGEISDAAVKGSVFGAGMGYLIAGREGAAGGLGVGVLGGPIGMAQGYALGKITGAGKITYATKENGKIVTKEVDSILDIPDQDLVSNFLAQLPSSDREVLTSQLLPPKLLELAKLDAFGRGMLIGGDTGDLNIRYMTTDQIAADPQLRGTLGSAEAGYEGVAIDDYNGKPLVVVNISEAVNPLRTLAHELFHPKFESGDPSDPLMAIRAQLESNLFGIKDQEGNEVVAGQYNDAQFKMLESDYVSMMSEGWQNEYYQRPIQARRSFVAGEILSESFGNFAEASKGDVAAYANKVNKRAKGNSPEAGLLTNQLYKFQSALLARMQNAFKAMGVEFDAGGNPVSKLFKDPSTARGIKLTGDGRLIGKGGEGLANSPEINALLSEYVLAKDKLLKRLSLADETEGSDGFAVSAKELLSKNDPGTVEKFRNSGMFKLDEQGNVQYENGMPVLLTRKQRKERETTVSMALFQALDSVAAGEYVTGLQRKVHSDGEVSYRGRYMSEEQLAAIMQLPDEVVPQSMKAKIQKLNENLAKGFDAVGNLEGDPAMNFLISYYKATTGSAYTSRASMKHQHVSPYGFSISKAGNFNLETFSISRFENKLNNWWKRAQKGNSKYKKFFDLFGGSRDNFRSAAVQYMHNQVRGVRNEATPQKDAIYDFMNAGEQGMMEQNPDRISTNKEHVVPISLRVDRMEEVNTIMGDTFPVNYGKLKRNFMPAGAGKGGAKFMPTGKKKGLPPVVGEVSKGYKGKRTLGKLGRATERNKELQDLAQNVDQMSQAEWNAAVERLDPIIPTPDSKIPNPSMFKAMDRSLKALDKNGKPFVMDVSQYKNIRNPAPGSNVKKVRIDISAMERAMEAYSRDEIETPLHPVAFYDENGIGYASHLYIKDGTFSYPGNIQPRILETSQGRSKDTFIFTEGEVIGGPLPSRAELMRVNNKGERVWTEAGVNPLRHGYAYDKNNPSIKIHGGDRMLLANNSVWVRNARKVEAVKVPGLKRMGSGEFEGPEVRYMPAGRGVEVAPGRVRAEDGAEFNLSKPILAQFMPAKKVQLENYKDRAIFALAADNLAVGDLEVGPTGAKAPIDVPAQGGRGFQFLDPDNMIWAFTDESAAKRLIKRGLDVSGGKNTVIMGVTSQGSTTHFNSAYGLNGFVRNLEAGVESGTFSSKRMNQYVKDLMGLVAKSESKDFTPQQRKIISGIKGLRGLRRAVESKKINFATAGMIKDKFTNIGKRKDSKLEIIQPELVEAGMDLSSLMRDMSDPELRDAKIGDVVALVELNLTKRPRKTDFHYSYPWTVEGKPIGFLKEFHNVRDLTSSTKIYQGKGKAKLKKNIGPQPLQTVMPVFDKLGTYFMPAGKGGDIFYSNSSKALESPKVRNSATGPAMLNDIIRQDPAARQEMKWIDLDRWLMDKKGKVTKEEVQDFIDANQIAVVEKVRGGEESPEIRAAEEAVEDARQAMYDADDRGTYQEARDAEMAFEEAVANLEFVSKDFDPQFDQSNLSLPGAVKGSYRELELMFPKRKGEQFKDSHFETDENVFAHVRFNERVDADGKRMLFIEEVQGDWAASGRERGFNEPYINGDVVGGREESVPAAPFVSKRKGNRFVEDDKWRALAMKRMIRWGADNGYDRVGWITGRDTADRYNLSKFIDRVEYQRLPGEDRTLVSAWDKAGNKIIPDRMVASKDMKRTVGRDLAEQIAADKSGSGEFEGLELAVGGEGHKQFYDIDLPNYTGKYVKKWGGKVGMVDVSLRAAEDVEALKGIPERTTKAHYVDITPQMKSDVQQGQAMFMPAASDAAYMKAAKRGDTKGAQLLVDKAAKAAGYTIGPVYHGTSEYGFNVFDKGLRGSQTGANSASKGFFFSTDKTVASGYMHLGEGDLGADLLSKIQSKQNQLNEIQKSVSGKSIEEIILIQKEQYDPIKSELDQLTRQLHSKRMARGAVIDAGGTPAAPESSGIYSVHLKHENPLLMDFKGKNYRPESFDSIIERAISDGHDSVVIKNAVDAATAETSRVSDIHIVFDPNQIKSADPITRDDAGNIIPLSERFQPSSDDIRYMPASEKVVKDIESLLDKYDEGGQGIETVEDVLVELNNIISEERIYELDDAISDLNKAIDDDWDSAGRGGEKAEGEERFLDALDAFVTKNKKLLNTRN